MKEITSCTMDCPDACSVVVSSDRDGSISIRGNPDHPITAGYTCKIVRNHIKRLQSPDRIRHPMRRTDNGWQLITWDAALDLCAEKIENYRGESTSILHIQGSGAKGVLKEATKLFFDKLGASRVKGSLCDSTGIVAYIRDFGSRKNHDINDLANAQAIINWGKDLARSSIHTGVVIKKARREGTKVLTISPGGDGSEAYSDRHIQIRPGTDRFLAAAVIRRFIENNRISQDILKHTKRWETFCKLIESLSLEDLTAACDVTPSVVNQVFDWYAQPSTVATLVGAGLQRYAHGGETIRFINALALLSGHIGEQGGGSYFHLDSFRNLNLSWIKDEHRKHHRSFQLPIIGREILEADNPPVEMIWVNGVNIINQAADSHETIRAFERTPFKVVVDAFFTDTAERADLVLPPALMLEQEDIIGSFLHEYVQYVKAVCTPPEGVRDDYTILTELGKRLNPPIFLPDFETCLKTALETPFLDISLAALRENHFIRAHRSTIPYADMRFDHSDGKYRFPIMLHSEPKSPDGFPLRLLTLVRRDTMHSQILPENQNRLPHAWIAPECPVWTRLDEDKDIYLVSPKGKLQVHLMRLTGLHPGTVLYRRGDWMKFGGGANQIIEAGLTDMGTGAAFYDQYVRLENG